MKIFETWRTWLVILGLLLFSGIASVIWLSSGDVDLGLDVRGFFETNPALTGEAGEVEGEQELVTIELEQYLLGEALVEMPLIRELNGVQVHPLVLTAILAAIFVGGLFVLGLPLAFIYIRLDRQTEALKEDPDFQAKQAELRQREREQLKELEERQPPTPMPDHEQPRSFAFSISLIVLLFVVVLGFSLGDTLFPEREVELIGLLVSPATVVVLVLTLLALIALVAVFRSRRAPGAAEGATEEGVDESPIPWGTIWVLVTGLIFLGIGTGLMLAIRAAGSG